MYNNSSRPRTGGSKPAFTRNGRRPAGQGNFNGGNTGGRRFGGGGNGGGKGRKAATIHPSKFINKAVAPREETPYVPTHSFADFGFVQQLATNVANRKYTTPSAIQDQAIPLILEGRDVIGLANTGTGKTAAFSLPIIQRLLQNQAPRMSVLVMAPTRELAQQIDEQVFAFTKHLGIYSTVCVGGTNINPQIRALQRRPHIIIGTPGRLQDLVNQKHLDLSGITTLVLDEADQMLDMGFLPAIRKLVALLPAERQSLCFSATITPEIQTLIHDMLKDPATVSVRTAETSEHVEQNVVYYESKDHKLDTLHELLNQPEFSKVLVFGETKWGVQRLAETLMKSGITAEAIHGNKSQGQRQRALKNFKDERATVLVATDVAARGLDIPNVTHVINYDQPNTYQDYVHRIGRTGRAGQRGHALTFVEKRS